MDLEAIFRCQIRAQALVAKLSSELAGEVAADARRDRGADSAHGLLVLSMEWGI